MSKTTNPSQCDGDSVHNTQPPSHLDGLEGRLKKISVNRCELCQIGIGKSVLFSNGTWREYVHDCKKVYEFKYKDGALRVCVDCFENLSKTEDPTRYIRKNIGKRRPIDRII